VLPTPRAYAPYPFFNMQNSRDAFVALEVAPRTGVSLKLSARSVRLADSADLWYVGGGAFDRRTFGYAGRPAGGATDLGTALDLSVEWRRSAHVSLAAYAALASGGAVMEHTYGHRPRSTFAFLETTLRW
jgi:hypothetical protein